MIDMTVTFLVEDVETATWFAFESMLSECISITTMEDIALPSFDIQTTFDEMIEIDMDEFLYCL